MSGASTGPYNAKFAVADRRRLLVSSANLTENAFDLNIELGVLLTGGNAPVEAAAHIDNLIRLGILLRRCPHLPLTTGPCSVASTGREHRRRLLEAAYRRSPSRGDVVDQISLRTREANELGSPSLRVLSW